MSMDDKEACEIILRRIYDLRETRQFVRLDQLADLGFDAIQLDPTGQLARPCLRN